VVLVREAVKLEDQAAAIIYPQVWQWRRTSNALALLKCRASISTSRHNAMVIRTIAAPPVTWRRLLEEMEAENVDGLGI